MGITPLEYETFGISAILPGRGGICSSFYLVSSMYTPKGVAAKTLPSPRTRME
jgi:hypothetical protein